MISVIIASVQTRDAVNALIHYLPVVEVVHASLYFDFTQTIDLTEKFVVLIIS